MDESLVIRDAKTLSDFMARQSALATLVPKGMELQRMLQIAVAEIARCPRLKECTLYSFYCTFHRALQMGLELGGPRQLAHAVPFSNKGRMEAQLILGWRGIIHLARQSGEVASIYTSPVYENDKFEVKMGLTRDIVHEPNLDDPGVFRAAYAVVKYRDGSDDFEVMTKKQIDSIRAAAPGRDSDAWRLWYDEMARKTVLRRLGKRLPQTTILAEQLDKEDNPEGQPETKPVSAVETPGPAIPAPTFDVPPMPTEEPPAEPVAMPVIPPVGAQTAPRPVAAAVAAPVTPPAPPPVATPPVPAPAPVTPVAPPVQPAAPPSAPAPAPQTAAQAPAEPPKKRGRPKKQAEAQPTLPTMEPEPAATATPPVAEAPAVQAPTLPQGLPELPLPPVAPEAAPVAEAPAAPPAQPATPAPARPASPMDLLRGMEKVMSQPEPSLTNELKQRLQTALGMMNEDQRKKFYADVKCADEADLMRRPVPMLKWALRRAPSILG